MLSTILSAFTVAEIRKKLAFTALLLALYRLGSHIPVPGIDVQAVDQIQRQFGNGGILNLLNTFSGGGLSRIALFALGIMPYITASIILQLLQVVIPSLEKLKEEGEVGQQRITQYTRYLTVALAFAQAIGYVFLFKSFSAQAGQPLITHFTAPRGFLIVLCLTAGCILVLSLGQSRTPRRLGDGGPLIFAASIMAFPPTLGQLTQSGIGDDIASFFSPNDWAYIVGETIFIILFTYFYTAVTFNPVDQADNLRKYGGGVPPPPP